MIFNKKRKESKEHNDELLIPVLFGEFNETQFYKLFPGSEVLIKMQQWDALAQILLEKTKSGESRIRYAAWKALRNLSIYPDEDAANEVLGVVIEVNMGAGVDYLAAYSDNTARYYNFSGSKIIYEQYNDETMNREIQKLLSHCVEILNSLVLYEVVVKLEPPAHNMAKINVMTPRGLFCGEGLLDAFESNELLGNLMSQGVVVMTSLIRLSENAKTQ